GELRASEHTYQLLHQLSGRAGREAVAGKVYLQSYLPTHPVMQALLSGDRAQFLEAEITARKNADMPPFSRLAALIIDGPDEAAVLKTCRQLAATAPQVPGLRVLGPAPAPLSLLRGRFRYRLLAHGSRKTNLPELMKTWVEAQNPPGATRIKIDIDPVNFL
ncbi:MAG: primosomal protein N', partial [Rickettsiales bacterium]|nr:primosomal protein N' [Rickettsiales bacterium]